MKKRVRDKRGFTLIELLVVIALMLSILGIAVVSFVGISNKKKESSKELIKEQIETAALEYFNANEFLFSNLKDDAFGVISVGKLVNDDYLNVVTNPVTGKRIGNCTIVVVKRKNNKFTSDVDDESFENATDNQTGTQLTNVCDSILVSSDDIQGGKITYYDENYKKLTGKRFKDLSDNKKLWFNSKHLGENKNLIACSEDEVEVKNLNGKIINVEKNSHGYCATIENGTNEDITYSSKDWALTVAERVDTTPPIVSNLKVESENSYIGSERLDDSKEYMSKFYSFKLTPKMDGLENIFTYNETNANSIRSKSDTSHYCTSGGKRVRCIDNVIRQSGNGVVIDSNSHDAEDLYVDKKLLMIRHYNNSNYYENVFRDELINKITSKLDNNGKHIIFYLEKEDLPNDINKYYYEQFGSDIYYDQEPKYKTVYSCNGNGSSCYISEKRNGVRIKSEEIKNNETRKILDNGKRIIYYTKQNILCKINQTERGNEENICVKIVDAYPNSINISTVGIFSTLYRTIPHYSSVYSKAALLSAPAYANYGKEINGQLTKVSFTYNDDTSKVYSYGINKKFAKKVKRNERYGDLIEPYLTETLKTLNSLLWFDDDRDLYNFSYTTDKNKSLKGEGLNEEYNKEVLNSVEIYDFKQSEDNYKKEKVNKKEESVGINHIYSFEDNSESKLDGSISNYKLTIKDNAGNEATSEENYKKYKNCTYVIQKVWDSPVNEQSCEDKCNSHGTLVKKRGTGMVAWVDEATEEFCSEPEFFGDDEVRIPNSSECPWTDCTTPSLTPTPNKPNQPNEPKEYTRKAFKFSEMDNFCSNKSTVSFSNCNSSDSSLNCRPNYPYKRYKFKELECSCTKDNGNITATSTNVTRTTHPDGYSYIFYTSEANCNKKANEGKNNVIQVCQHKVGDYLDFHGVYWNQGSANYWSGEGWYNNNYVHKKSVDEFTSEKKVCEWACQE